ncbi:TetR/AcrR family transcriptional regulator [Methylocystis bryophila]|uniref:TetR/AcrR family transcriptional regulator n=1 Tax=Methylocystis bryophila TaxID=655015 RepID=UPI001FDA9ED8|nr:TetR-like C-terminal domain-containing protein [Methylocystis bryophila]BDV38708.1 TetR family transcriptional regulator [Methylocystis bryophila]
MGAAQTLIADKGLAGLKAREVAQAAGCALGAIYTVFADLDELILRVNARTLTRLEAALAQEGDGDALEVLALAYLAFARREEPSWRALFGFRLPPGSSLPDWFVTERDRLFALLESPLSELLPDHAPEDVRRTARTLFSAVHGIVSLGLEDKLGDSAGVMLEAELEAFVGTFARGLAVAARKRRQDARARE